MKVTPLDLRQQRFNTVMRGYDRGEVTAFLNEVADEESMMKSPLVSKAVTSTPTRVLLLVAAYTS